MRISDARVGDVLRDAEGDLWVMVLAAKKLSGAFRHEDGDPPCSGDELARLDEDDRAFPFTRLVPEKEGDNAE